MSQSLQWVVTFYSVLIRLYPRQFKHEFADELLSVFTALACDAASTGSLALTVFCLRELRDFPVNLFCAHLEDNLMSKIFDSDSWRFMLRGVLMFVVLCTLYNLAFFLIVNQINGAAALFFASGFWHNYYQALILLSSWVMAAAIAGTVFAVMLGERPRARWLVTLAVVALLPCTIPYIIIGLNGQLSPAVFGPHSQFNPNHLEMHSISDFSPDLVWAKIVAFLLFTAICAILMIMLFKEQPRFRWFTLAAMGVWLPPVLVSDPFSIAPILGLSKLPMEFQRVLVNFVLGGCMAGVLGMLLQNRRKLFLLMIAGGLLYIFADYVVYQQIYFQFLPILFPNLATMNDMTNEQFAMLASIVAALIGLVFGLPVASIFIWLKKWKFPVGLQPSAQ